MPSSSAAAWRLRPDTYGTEAEIFPNMAHAMMLEPGWRAVAERICGWLEETLGAEEKEANAAAAE